MTLYGYWRSSATYRVRIALALKNLDYAYRPINLLAGEQREDAYRKIHPQGLVPALVREDGSVMTQSLAIIEYLEDAFPTPSIMPADLVLRAKARAVAAALACEAQPFMNLRIQKYLKGEIGLDSDAMTRWLNTWPGGAMSAAENIAQETGGAFCIGDTPAIADVFLVPQMFGAIRFGVDVSRMPKLCEIAEHCNSLPAFEKAHPLNQPDAERQ